MRKSALAAATLAVLLLGGCATPYMAARAAEKERVEDTASSLYGQKYVAMGSSFAAGPMLPPPKPGAPVRCGQSLSNYPTLLAERFGMVLVDVTCSGAKTQHILGPWNEISPQIDAVTADTRLVTVTIGGNDLNYIGNLFTSTCLQATELKGPAGNPAKCGPMFIPGEADYAKDEAALGEIARQVRARAPKAKLVFVQYLTPLAAELCAVTPIRPGDAEMIRTIGRRLAEITARAAQAHGAIVVEMNQASAMHTPCDAEPWMIGFPPAYDGKQGLQWHLNKAGMQATADGIAYWLSQPAEPQVLVGGDDASAPEPAKTAPATQPR